MRKKESGRERIADALDVPLDVVCDLPRIEIIGTSRASIENFRGILDYDESCIKVNTTAGIVKISGDDIFIESITDDGIMIKGTIRNAEFI